MRLKHITFTGIDARTDLQELQAIQQQYPLAEFGVLTSYHWYENGNRYINPQFLCNLWGQRLNLALHVCGSAAHDAAMGEWYKIDDHLSGALNMFKRIQLNVANRTDNPKYLWSTHYSGQELIVQQRNAEDVALYAATLSEFEYVCPVSVLLDASGGQGIYTPIKILKTLGKVGYAGGINPDNVAEKLSFLLQNVRMGEFWIDMESGVRTDDWLDLGKVRKVLEICELIIKDYSKED